MLFRSRLYKLLLILLLGGSSAGICMAAEPAGQVPTILVYGDSLSAAYSMPREQGWVALLQERLRKKGFPHRVVNASISGETTSGGLARLASTLEQHEPDIVLLELGANDGLRGLPLASMQRNLRSMIEASQAADASVVLLGILIPPNYGPRYTRQFAASYIELADRYDLPLLPFLLEGIAGKPELTLDDGLHPNADAQEKILDNVWQTLQPMLKKS
jgi:acyl-CoA thioesterase-1